MDDKSFQKGNFPSRKVNLISKSMAAEAIRPAKFTFELSGRNSQWALTDRKGKRICSLKIAQKSCNSHFFKKERCFSNKR